MFKAALFTITKSKEATKRPLAGGRIRKMWYIHIQ